MKNKGVIGWGVIGGGQVVERKSGPGFNIPGKSRITAVMRRDAERAQATANTLGADGSYTSIEALLEDPTVDAVYIATPPGLHYQQAMMCCQAGKPVYIEKPFTTKTTDAVALVASFDQACIPIFVAHYRRALPRFQKAKEIISERLGAIVDFDLRLTRNLADDIDHPWYFVPEMSGGGKFADIGPHSIDTLLYLFGSMDEVLGVAHHLRAPNGREDAVCVAFRTVEGITGTANFNFLSNKRWDSLSVYGTDGELHLSIHGKSPMKEVFADVEHTYDMPLPECIEGPMIQEVVNYMLGLSATPCFGREAIETVKIVENILRTLR